MKCPHCDKPMRLPEAAQRNMEAYRGHVNVVTDCCGNMVIAYPVTAFHAYRSTAKVDDWGTSPNPITTNKPVKA